MTSSGDIGRFDPFEDTGDWPFRDAPPRTEAVVEEEEQQPHLEPAAAASVVEPDPQPEPEPDPGPLPQPDPEPLPEPDPLPEPEPEPEPDLEPQLSEELVPQGEVAAVEEVPEAEVVVVEEEQPAPEEDLAPASLATEHAPGVLAVPPGVDVLEGGPHGFRRNVAVVVSRFNGDITTGLLASALSELRDCNVSDDAITVVPVPGAFELPLTALALAKTRRFSCVLALGCIIRGETPHFDLIASEAASGLQLAAIETGIPVAFGVITAETREQAEARVDRGAEAARTALEMADLFSHVRTRAAGA
jgi:6,7-dimethyl-8-ribityllumazine synthase